MFSSAFYDQKDFGPFKRQANVFPVDVARKPELENGDKIILPASFLEELTRREISYPMMFKLENSLTSKSIYCGVIEFSAEPGTAYIPKWMMTYMKLQDGGNLTIYNVTLQKGTFALIRPHSYKFNLLPDPKAILEFALRGYASLTRGTTIQVTHSGTTYYFDIQDLQPARAVCIIETDLRVDFAPPRDIKEYEAILENQKKEKQIKDRFLMTASTPVLHHNSNEFNGDALNLKSDGSSGDGNIFAAPIASNTSNPFLTKSTGGRTINDSGPSQNTTTTTKTTSPSSSVFSSGGNSMGSSSSTGATSGGNANLRYRDPEEVRNARAAGLLARLGNRGKTTAGAGSPPPVSPQPSSSSQSNLMGDDDITPRKVERIGKIIIEEESPDLTQAGTTREVVGGWVYYKDITGRLIKREPFSR